MVRKFLALVEWYLTEIDPLQPGISSGSSVIEGSWRVFDDTRRAIRVNDAVVTSIRERSFPFRNSVSRGRWNFCSSKPLSESDGNNSFLPDSRERGRERKRFDPALRFQRKMVYKGGRCSTIELEYYQVEHLPSNAWLPPNCLVFFFFSLRGVISRLEEETTVDLTQQMLLIKELIYYPSVNSKAFVIIIIIIVIFLALKV